MLPCFAQADLAERILSSGCQPDEGIHSPTSAFHASLNLPGAIPKCPTANFPPGIRRKPTSPEAPVHSGAVMQASERSLSVSVMSGLSRLLSITAPPAARHAEAEVPNHPRDAREDAGRGEPAGRASKDAVQAEARDAASAASRSRLSSSPRRASM